MFENYKRKQSHWVIPERSPKEIYERWLGKGVVVGKQKNVFTHIYRSKVLCRSGHLHITVEWHIIFYLLLASHRVIPYMFSLWLILGYPVGGECIWVALASTHF